MSDITLVFQPVPPVTDSEDFAEAIHEVRSSAGAIDLVSPYLGCSVLSSIVRGRDFRLVTDLDACLERNDRDLAEFLASHHVQVRDIRGVHAKVVIGADSALLGSANLTKAGLCSRLEMACILRDEALDQLRGWFERLWAHASAVDRAEILDRVSRGAREPVQVRAQGSVPLGRTGRLGWMAPGDAPDSELIELAHRIQTRTPDRDAARHAVELLREALEVIDLPVEDDRLHLNFGKRPISITLGQRFVAVLQRKSGVDEFGMILDSFEVQRECIERFPDARHSAFLVDRRPEVPMFFWPPAQLKSLPSHVRASWHRGIRAQLQRAGRSSYRKNKRVSPYTMLMDDALRADLVRRAHPARPK